MTKSLFPYVAALLSLIGAFRTARRPVARSRKLVCESLEGRDLLANTLLWIGTPPLVRRRSTVANQR